MKKINVLYNKVKLFMYRKWLSIFNSKNKILNLNILLILGLIIYKFVNSFNGGSVEILGFINSVLEASEHVNNYTPLEELIVYQFTLNALVLIFILMLLTMLFNRFILTSNLKFITSLFDKYTSNKISQWFNNKINKGIDYNNRFTLFLFLFLSLIIIINLILSLFISSELLLSIDDYVTVYNHLKKN